MKKFIGLFTFLFVVGIALIAQDGVVEEPTGISWIWQAISGALVVLAGIASNAYTKVKSILKQVVNVLTALKELISAGVDLAEYTIASADDNVFNAEEKAAIKVKALKFKTEVAEFKAVIKLLFKGKVEV